MRRINAILASLAISGMALSMPVTASAASAQSGMSGAGGAGSVCRVAVRRNASAGVFDVTRQILSNGNCVCRVSTGPRSQGGSAESALASLLLRRSCADAPLAGAAATGGGLSTGALLGLGALAAGGVIAAVVSGGSNSP